jgi:carboxyl-terminal processing protease
MTITRTLLIATVLGAVAASPAPAQTDSLAALRSVPAELERTLRAHLFDSRLLDESSVRRIAAESDSLARVAVSRRAFASAYTRLWRGGPVSHVRLEVARMPAAAMADFVDTMRIGGGGVALRWDGDVAVLEVRSMMGVDTREGITIAFREIVARSAKALVVDLRANEGGAFAVVPLVGHLIDRGFEGGIFVGRRWNDTHEARPTAAEIAQLTPWSGWSLKRFWSDVESAGVLRIRFEPMAPHFAGPVAVLTSGRTASAAELAADALSANGRASLIGERTAGNMLSQRMFDIPGGLQLSLPIADYYSARLGRIEGAGVAPTVPTSAAAALDTALARLRGAGASTRP